MICSRAAIGESVLSAPKESTLLFPSLFSLSLVLVFVEDDVILCTSVDPFCVNKSSTYGITLL